MGPQPLSMSDKKLFEDLTRMCIDSDGKDTTCVTELRHLITGSDTKGVAIALDCLKVHIKGKTQASIAAFTVLRELMQNCSSDFQSQLATKEWMDRFKKVAAKGDMTLKDLIMQCLVEWRDEFKFESWGDVFGQGVKDLEETGLAAPEGKPKKSMRPTVSQPNSPKHSRDAPNTAEKSNMRGGVVSEAPVTAGDDYWKAECENWRNKWEQEASTILSLEQTMQKMRATGGAEVDTKTVKGVLKQLKVLKFQIEDLKDRAMESKDEFASHVEDAQALIEKAVASACAANGKTSAAPAPAKKAPAPAPEPAPEAEPAAEPEPAAEKPAPEAEPKEKKKRAKPAKSDRSPKDRLVSFFEKHNPDNISKIDKPLLRTRVKRRI